MNDTIPYVSIQPHKISIYNRSESLSRARSDRQRENELNLKNPKSDGVISAKASKNISRAIDWLLFLSNDKKVIEKRTGKHYKFKLNFVTLTLSSKQVHSDKVIKDKLLNHFLLILKRRWNVENYIWRAEAQKNGNIHFHIVSDKFIPWDDLRFQWNKIQNKLGYVDKYAINMRAFHKDGFRYQSNYGKKWNYQKQLKAYKIGVSSGWSNPNSTDVHSIRHVRNIANYLNEYITKNSSARKIDGRLWRLSYSLSRLKSAIEVMDQKIKSEISFLINRFPDRIKFYDYCSILYVSVDKWSKYVKNELYSIFTGYVGSVGVAEKLKVPKFVNEEVAALFKTNSNNFRILQYEIQFIN